MTAKKTSGKTRVGSKTSVERALAKLSAASTPKAAAQARESGGLALVAACRKHAARLVEIAFDIAENGRNDRDRLQAIALLLDRGYGKAPQLTTIVKELPPEQLEAIVEAIHEKRRLKVIDAQRQLGGANQGAQGAPTGKRTKK